MVAHTISKRAMLEKTSEREFIKISLSTCQYILYSIGKKASFYRTIVKLERYQPKSFDLSRAQQLDKLRSRSKGTREAIGFLEEHVQQVDSIELYEGLEQVG